jgi:hypothetical protein
MPILPHALNHPYITYNTKYIINPTLGWGQAQWYVLPNIHEAWVLSPTLQIK